MMREILMDILYVFTYCMFGLRQTWWRGETSGNNDQEKAKFGL